MNKGQKRSKAQFDILGRIYEEKNKRGWSDYKLAEYSSITASTLATWKNNNIEPGVASIEKICAGLGISLSQFFQESDDSNLTEEQKDLLGVWGRLSPSQKEKTIDMLKSFVFESEK